MGNFNSMQSVKVNKPDDAFDGKAGYVVKAVNDLDGSTPVEVKMDVDNQVHEFAQADLQPL